MFIDQPSHTKPGSAISYTSAPVAASATVSFGASPGPVVITSFTQTESTRRAIDTILLNRVDKLTLGERIAQDIYGEVYRARESRDGKKEFTLLVVEPRLAADDQFAEALSRAAQNRGAPRGTGFATPGMTVAHDNHSHSRPD